MFINVTDKKNIHMYKIIHHSHIYYIAGPDGDPELLASAQDIQTITSQDILHLGVFHKS